MTNADILEKAIAQAVENGWDFGEHIQLNSDLEVVLARRGKTFFYDHDFAKAFWGEDGVCAFGHPMSRGQVHCKEFACGMEKSELSLWQYHLQQQVISDEPIKYLERGLK